MLNNKIQHGRLNTHKHFVCDLISEKKIIRQLRGRLLVGNGIDKNEMYHLVRPVQRSSRIEMRTQNSRRSCRRRCRRVGTSRPLKVSQPKVKNIKVST